MPNSTIPKQTNQEFLRKFDEAIEWMRSLRVNVNQGRLTDYRTAAHQWVSMQDEDRDRKKGLEHLPAITSAVYEVSQFLEIHAAFRDEPLTRLGGIGAKMKQAIEGQCTFRTKRKSPVALGIICLKLLPQLVFTDQKTVPLQFLIRPQTPGLSYSTVRSGLNVKG
jgi:hypothetical protein